MSPREYLCSIAFPLSYSTIPAGVALCVPPIISTIDETLRSLSFTRFPLSFFENYKIPTYTGSHPSASIWSTTELSLRVPVF